MNFARISRWGFLAGVVALGVSAPGCGGLSGSSSTGAATVENRSLEEIGRMFRPYQKGRKPPPKDVKDLLRFEQGYPIGVGDLRSKVVVVYWGSGLADTSEAATTVLAYQKDVPDKGGVVLMQDGTTQKMTAEEFKAAPKAGK